MPQVVVDPGQGGGIEFAALQRAPLKNSLLASVDAEALSYGTIKFGFNLQRRFAAEQQKLIAELKAFKEQLWNAFYQGDDDIRVADFMKVKATLSEVTREVYENTQTEVLLERN